MADMNEVVKECFTGDVSNVTHEEAVRAMSMVGFLADAMGSIYEEMGEMAGEEDTSITPEQEAIIVMKAIAARARMDSEWMA